MIHIPIFFYSKYCKECPKILSVIDPNRFLFICVDNPDIRKKIVEDKRFQIKTVPCILYFENDKTFEKYENENVIKWLHANNMFCIEELPPQKEEIPEEYMEPINVKIDTIKEQEDKEEEEEKDEISNAISTKNNVLTLAQQMQRERESQPVLNET